MPANLAIVGCGDIAGRYVDDLLTYDHVNLLGGTDLDHSRAVELCKKFEGRAYQTLEELLADDSVELVVNLSIHHAHYEVIHQCLSAGRHVFTEKPLTMKYAQAAELVELAKRQNVRLGCAPFVFLGEAHQAALRQIREDRIGPVRVVYGEANWGRIESWHDNPEPFYDVGPFFDVGVYPLTLITAALGPAKRVTAVGRVVYPDRQTKEGRSFKPGSPDFVTSMLEFENGAIARVTANFYVSMKSAQPPAVEFHGDRGSVWLADWHNFGSEVSVAEFGEPYQPLEYEPKAESHFRWGRGVAEMVQATEENRPHRATGEQGAHIVEILDASYRSIETGRPVDLTSTFPEPALLESAAV